MRKKSTRKKKKRKLKTAIIPNRAYLPLRSIIFACLTFFLIANISLQGREKHAKAKPVPYALIFGTVWGPDDRPVYGVTVKICRATDRRKRARWEVHSNRLGEFEQRVPAGRQDYVIWADLEGLKSPAFKRLRPGPEVTVHIENDERANTGLHLK